MYIVYLVTKNYFSAVQTVSLSVKNILFIVLKKNSNVCTQYVSKVTQILLKIQKYYFYHYDFSVSSIYERNTDFLIKNFAFLARFLLIFFLIY